MNPRLPFDYVFAPRCVVIVTRPWGFLLIYWLAFYYTLFLFCLVIRIWAIIYIVWF